MKVKGIKRGQTIELLEEVDTIQDGEEVVVEIELEFVRDRGVESKANLTDEEKLARLNQLFGAWKDQPDLIEIFTEIDRERHAYRGRKIDPLEDRSED